MNHSIKIERLFILVAFAFLISFTSCDLTKKDRQLQEAEKLEIQSYLNRNDTLHFELKECGIYYLDIKEGTGALIATHDTAYVFYSMKNLAGVEIETNIGKDTLYFPVNEGMVSVRGFDFAVTFMKEGGKSKFIVPSSLAFGSYGTNKLAPYTPLLFDVELVKIARYTGSR